MDPDLPSPSTDPSKITDKTEPKSDDTTSFLFVNETVQSTEYKVGHRPAIRSHVRRHATKHSKPKNKPERNERRIAARTSRVSQQRQSLVWQNDTHDAFHSPDCETCSIESGSSTTNDHSEPTELDCPQDLGLYCKACHAQLDTTAPNTGTVVLKKQRLMQQSKLSPLEILGSGRSDPFSTYPVENPNGSLHQLMDFVVNYFVPRLCPDDAPPPGLSSGANIVSRAWFTAGLKNPLLFHALAFAGLIHMDFLRYHQIYPDSVQALPHKLIVIQKLNEAIKNGSEMSTDDVILAILTLASHETLKVTEEKRRPFNSPLRRAQWINVYGHIKYIEEHRKAVLDLLNLRGGLETLQLPGLAETIVGGDIMSAMNSFTHPILPVLRSHETYIAAVKVWASNQHAPSSTSEPLLLASAFWNLQQYGITAELLSVLDAMGALTLAIRHYLLRAPGSLTLGQIARTRTAVQKRLLLVPSSEELNTSTHPKADSETDGGKVNVEIYECCRLAAMIFNVAVIAPIPDTYDVLQIYVSHLKSTLLCSGLLVQMSTFRRGSSDLQGFLLWVLVMGGIASLEKEEREWFVQQLKEVKEMTGMQWEEVREGMERYLWDESACGEGGKELWGEIEVLGGKYTNEESVSEV
ncbi:hypothetical protein N431DRAFT_465948 [Stipitochalara longipes BDJ]|nr:hypothetical protein N431DRAFT_465948 [Stipitochalara longipes BDJ]